MKGDAIGRRAGRKPGAQTRPTRDRRENEATVRRKRDGRHVAARGKGVGDGVQGSEALGVGVAPDVP